MTSRPTASRLSLTSVTGARIALVLGLLVAVALLGALRSATAPPRGDGLPAGVESQVVADELARMPGHGVAPVLVVATAADGSDLTRAQLDDVAALGHALGEHTGHEASPPRPSEDGRAAVVAVPVTLSADSSGDVTSVDALRAEVADRAPDGLTVQITGGPAFGADVASAFDGADLTLLLVTIAVVAVLLLLTYRSPVLWLVPLAVVGLADQVAGRVAAGVGQWSGLDFDAGIVSVLVFGAGTNYALLLISRYREELRVEADHRRALDRAWRGSVPAILASNGTVVLALLTLLLASVPSTRGLGLASAAGLLVALAACVLVLPAALAMCGRRVFWPFVPRPGDPVGVGVWGRVAAVVVRRPATVLAGGLLVLAVMASGLLGTKVGLSQVDSFRGSTESAAGLTTLSRHFPAGESAPFDITAAPGHVEDVTQAVEGVRGVTRVTPVGEPVGDRVRLSVVGAPSPGTDASLDLARELRSAVHAVPGADARVGGASAQMLDSRAAAAHDLRLIAPLVLLVGALVLLVLLRSLVAPLVLLVCNVASSLAAIGLGAWLSERVLGYPALDSAVPLLAFLFLVALGIDYTIFLVHRARAEAREHGTREGTVRAVGLTGVVITSAGVVLAGVFAALGVLPLVVLAQLGLVVGLGVLVDTLLVRTLLVPAAIEVLGRRFWWPSGLARRVPR